MAKTVFANNVTINVGDRNFGPLNIQNNVSGFTLTASRAGWPDIGGDLFRLVIDISMDGGNTWELGWLGFSTVGGTLLDRQGNVVAETTVSRQFPAGTNRRARMTVTAFAQFTTTLSLDLT